MTRFQDTMTRCCHISLSSRALNAAILAVCLFSLLLSTPAFAQLSTGGKEKTASQSESPQSVAPQTRQAVRELISELDDRQVRALLIERLSQQVDARKRRNAQADNRSILQIVNGYVSALGLSIRETWKRVERIPGAFGKAYSVFEGGQPGETIDFVLIAIGALFAGLVAVWLVRTMLRGPEQRILQSAPANLWHKLRLIAGRLAIHLARLLVFVIASYAVAVAGTATGSPKQFTLFLIIQTIAWVWLATSLARFVMAPSRANLRLCPLDDATASLLTSRVTLVATIAGVGFGALNWLFQMGMPFGEIRMGFWLNLLIHMLILLTIWQSRRGIINMLTASETSEDGALQQFSLARNWPAIAAGLVIAHWFVTEIAVATGNATAGLLPVMMITLATLLSLPFLDHAIRALVCNLAPVDVTTTRPLQAAHKETQRGLMRCGRVMLGLALVLGLLYIWGVDPHALAQQGAGARFARGVIDSLLIVLICYALWELVTIVSDRQLAIERAVMGIDDHEEAMAEGEGGKGQTRLATIVPLLRLTAYILILVLGTLAVVSQLGINITPILAGAGIVGLAVGFGAQTLVKDIISGLFFLIDDAFRKGEYIDLGNVKGTVEKISVRSMQLRHHNGPLNTVPFGDIGFVTNFSRDWVVMKLPLRLTYDTDAEAVRKMIKKLGQEMMEEPALKGQFLQPLKSQGVIQMEDSAMIMRVKFMTRPGDQWMIRRIVFARIRDLFEKEGIKFANREVTVRIADDQRGEFVNERELKSAAAAARSITDN